MNVKDMSSRHGDMAQFSRALFPQKPIYHEEELPTSEFGDTETCRGVEVSQKYGASRAFCEFCSNAFALRLCWARSWDARGGNIFSWIQGQCWAARQLRRPSVEELATSWNMVGFGIQDLLRSYSEFGILSLLEFIAPWGKKQVFWKMGNGPTVEHLAGQNQTPYFQHKDHQLVDGGSNGA